ncbi:MAG TPA: MTH938/NDUFAF3 family protein [Gammaproteobacteria bacterium]|nr:MTH938/NDUFAF3 family protein [Gammaproteobacteria bacterium]
MQFTRETSAAHLIRAWEPGRVRIADRWIEGPIIVSPDRIIDRWHVREPARLELNDLQPAIELQPEIILLGTGTDLLLPDMDLVSALASLGVGLESMSTPAACRTFNVLVHERRRVVAALVNFPRLDSREASTPG